MEHLTRDHLIENNKQLFNEAFRLFKSLCSRGERKTYKGYAFLKARFVSLECYNIFGQILSRIIVDLAFNASVLEKGKVMEIR